MVLRFNTIWGNPVTQSYHRRHSRWYEVIIFNFWFQIVIGYLLIVILPQWLRYTADADETCIKLEHDFYYIKNLSLWLDILIVLKTIRTMLTGFGAR